MWRLSYRQEILSIPRLRASDGPDLSGGPRLRGKPFDQVVSILAFTPGQRSIAAPFSFGELRTSKIRCNHYAAQFLGEVARVSLRGRDIAACIPLLEHHRP